MATPENTPVQPETQDDWLSKYLNDAKTYGALADNAQTEYQQAEKQLSELPAYDSTETIKKWRDSGKPMMEFLMQGVRKPEQQITPEQEKKIRTASAITDGLRSVAEMFAHGQGARIRNNTQPSNQNTTNARLQAIRDKYLQDTDRYNAYSTNAGMQDLSMFMNDAKQKDANVRNYLMYKSKAGRENAAELRKAQADIEAQAVKYYQWLKEYGISEEEAKQKVNQFRKEMDLKWFEARTSRISATKPSKEDASGFVLNANPSDPNAQTDVLGKKVVSMPVSKEQVQQLANTARNDKEFLGLHPEVYVEGIDLNGKAYKGLTSEKNLAWSYAQYLYDKGYKIDTPVNADDYMFFKPNNNQQSNYKTPYKTNKTTTTNNDPLGLGL